MIQPSQITGDKIKTARIMAGYSQKEFAAAVEMTTNAIRNIETGKRRPHPKNFERIINALRARGIVFEEYNESFVIYKLDLKEKQ